MDFASNGELFDAIVSTDSSGEKVLSPLPTIDRLGVSDVMACVLVLHEYNV